MKLNNIELQNEIKRILNDQLNESGGIFNSSINSLKKGKYYLMGTNPGGDTNNHKEFTIEKDINSFFEKGGENLWLQICEWNYNIKYNLKNFLDNRISIHFPNEIFFTNLIFKRSKNLSKIKENFWDEAKKSWQVHEELMKIINPEIIITIGNGEGDSPYAFLKHNFGKDSKEEVVSAHYKNWKHKSFETILPSQTSKKIRIVGLAHLSYNVKIDGKVKKWLI